MVIYICITSHASSRSIPQILSWLSDFDGKKKKKKTIFRGALHGMYVCMHLCRELTAALPRSSGVLAMFIALLFLTPMISAGLGDSFVSGWLFWKWRVVKIPWKVSDFRSSCFETNFQELQAVNRPAVVWTRISLPAKKMANPAENHGACATLYLASAASFDITSSIMQMQYLQAGRRPWKLPKQSLPSGGRSPTHIYGDSQRECSPSASR